MPKIEISDELYRRLKAFVKVIDVVLGEKLSDKIDDYASLVLTIGLDRMLQDPLPKDKLLRETMVEMFKRNPEFVCDFLAEKLKEIYKTEEEEIKRARDEWNIDFT